MVIRGNCPLRRMCTLQLLNQFLCMVVRFRNNAWRRKEISVSVSAVLKFTSSVSISPTGDFISSSAMYNAVRLKALCLWTRKNYWHCQILGKLEIDSNIDFRIPKFNLGSNFKVGGSGENRLWILRFLQMVTKNGTGWGIIT